MAKILGLDLGTDSIGWAIKKTSIKDKNPITHFGVVVFPKGVGEDKTGEFSLAAERTKNRNMRKAYRRRKQRKTDLLKILSKESMCPLSEKELKKWAVYRKGLEYEYPKSEAFREWLKINPLMARAAAAEGKKLSKYELGRAFYHLCQRRGFKSNRLEISEKNLPKDETLSREFREKFAEKTIGQVMWAWVGKGKKVRNEMEFSRQLNEAEFDKICESQNLSPELSKKIKKAIFFQRQLKKQRHTVGKCTLEPKKPRCPMSAPIFEEYRAYQFLNSIKYRLADEEGAPMLPLSEAHRKLILPKFWRKSNFKFEEIMEAINGKEGNEYEFNFKANRTVSGSPTFSALKTYLGDDWRKYKKEYEVVTAKGVREKRKVCAHDIWHIWYSFDGTEHLKQFALKKLEFDEKKAEKFSRVKPAQGFARLSRNAISKILSQLKRGHQYSHAVFLANMDTVLGKELWEKERDFIESELDKIIESHSKLKSETHIVNSLIEQFKIKYNNAGPDYDLDKQDWENVERKLVSGYGKSTWSEMSESERAAIREEVGAKFQAQLRIDRGTFLKLKPLEDRIKDFLKDNFDVTDEDLEKLYHPSAIDKYPPAKPDKNHQIHLGSPMTSSIRNPMAMRTLHELRKLINEMLKKNLVDEDTKVVIELARNLNDTNKRWAIETWQRQREDENREFALAISEFYRQQKNIPNYIPDSKDIEKFRLWTEQFEFWEAIVEIFKIKNDTIKKYRLWKEQKGICLYTGKTISIFDLFEDNQTDLEHTFPRSKSFDNSLANLTVCEAHFNRKIKRNQAPFDLYEKGLLNQEKVLQRIEHWKKEIIRLDEQIQKLKRSGGGGYESKEAKDGRIRKRHLLQLELNYWSDKYGRFTAKEIKDTFKNSQIVDTGIVTKYARAFLQTVFEKVYTVKGDIVAEFRKLTGIQKNFEKKERKKHDHHAIDAIVASCLTPNYYQKLAKYYKEYAEDKRWKRDEMKKLKPWKYFVTDLKKLSNDILIVHHHYDNLAKQTRKKVRKHGKVVKDNETGKLKIAKGQGIRGRLHQDTFYGAIKRFDKDGNETIRYVKRVLLSDLKESNIPKIVDKRIREHFQKEKKNRGFKDILEKGIFMPKSKKKDEAEKPDVPIKKIRLFQKVSEPMRLKEQSNKSEKGRKEHKEFYYVQNDSNYELVVYEAEVKGKMRRKIKALNLMEAAEIYIRKNKELIPETLGKLPKAYHLRKGKMVLFYENGPDEIILNADPTSNDNADLNKRLYKVTEIAGSGRVKFKHHLDARNDNQLKEDFKNDFGDNYDKTLVTGKSQFEFQNDPSPKLNISPVNFNFLLEGKDFSISNTGEIKPVS